MENMCISEQKEYIKKVKKYIEQYQKKFTYNILTMGCQLNENDSEKLCGMIEEMGFIKTEKQENADLIVFNTCCVRENAEEKLFGKLGEIKELKKTKGTIIAIGGCMMQEAHIVEKINKSYKYTDIVFGTHTLHKFPEDLYNALIKNEHIRDVIEIDGEVWEGLPIKRNSDKQASVTIMYGCNNFCTYCIVPYVRGRERSRKSEDIINEICNLAKNGYKEVTLLGQNVNSYMKEENKKNGGSETFATLLRKVNNIDGIERIRFVSPHPKDFTDDVIEAIRDCEKVCKIIHLPLQSGSTNILKKMNRNYTKEQYLDLVEKMKKCIPNIVFSTDIIVGFPGETEEDFLETLDVVSKVKFEQVFMFIYSRRKGTVADKMENQIEESIKHKRFEKLKSLVESQIQENNNKYVGTIQKVFVEGRSKNNNEKMSGRTETNKVVVFEGSEEQIGTIINVKIISEHMWYLKGQQINKNY